MTNFEFYSILATVMVAWSLISFFVLAETCRFSRKNALLLLIALAFVSVPICRQQFVKYEQPITFEGWGQLLLLSLLPYLILFLAIAYLRKWRRSLAKDYPSVQACLADWFSLPMVTGMVVISVLTLYVTDVPVLSLALLGGILLLVYPAYYWSMMPDALQPAMASVSSSDENAPQAENLAVLGMIESGKISASEGAELLAALSLGTQQKVKSTKPLPKMIKVQTAGLVLIIAGFFLPWAKMNVQAEMLQHMASQIMLSDRRFNSGLDSMGSHYKALAAQAQADKSNVVAVTGFDINYAWVILVGALIALGLILLRSELSHKAARLTIGACQVAIVLTLLIVAGRLLSYIQPGMLVVLVGVILQGMAAFNMARRQL